RRAARRLRTMTDATGLPFRTPSPEGPQSGSHDAEDLTTREFESPPIPPGPPLGSSSNDELTQLLSDTLTKPTPDPLLGEYSADAPTLEEAETTHEEGAGPRESFDAVAILNAFTDPTPIDAVGPSSSSPRAAATEPRPDDSAIASAEDRAHGDRERLEGLTTDLSAASVPTSSAFDLIVGGDPEGPPPQPVSYDAFPSLDLSAPGTNPPAPAKHVESEADVEVEEEEEPARGSSIVMFLLISYASAVTLGLAWVLISGRKLRESEDVDVTPNLEARADPGKRADRSRKVGIPVPIAADHLIPLGKPIQLGDLEVTPMRVSSGAVALKRTISEPELRDGGNDALTLKVRLRNTSKDTIFAPLDEAFLRERDKDVLDTVIETGGGAEITMYPLAVTSEWSIDDQEFPELRPGESFEGIVVSAPDATSRVTDEMTWRLRLRTGIDHNDTLGVRFRKADVQTGR
ncbi:DUF4352 domain-containing protein, partial [Singulisphaera rosea]